MKEPLVDKYHVVRRLLLFAITILYIIVTYQLFLNRNVDWNAFKVTAYGMFTGVEVLFIKFYLDKRDAESKRNNKIRKDIENLKKDTK